MLSQLRRSPPQPALVEPVAAADSQSSPVEAARQAVGAALGRMLEHLVVAAGLNQGSTTPAAALVCLGHPSVGVNQRLDLTPWEEITALGAGRKHTEPFATEPAEKVALTPAAAGVSIGSARRSESCARRATFVRLAKCPPHARLPPWAG